MPAPLIYINAFPSVGKLTVAHALQSLVPGSKVLHNHKLIDPVEAQCPRDHPEYSHQRTAYRRQRLQDVINDSDGIYIFTDAQTEYDTCVADYHGLSLAPVGRRFFSIVLECEVGENVWRLISGGRGCGRNGKLTDVGVLRALRSGGEIWKFGGEDELVVDVKHLSAETSAKAIVEFLVARGLQSCLRV